jgi:hypothetical protein
VDTLSRCRAMGHIVPQRVRVVILVTEWWLPVEETSEDRDRHPGIAPACYLEGETVRGLTTEDTEEHGETTCDLPDSH